MFDNCLWCKFSTLLCVSVFTQTNVDGNPSRCVVNKTIFVPEDSTASFEASFHRISWIQFYKTAPEIKLIFEADNLYTNITDNQIIRQDIFWKNRIHLSGQTTNSQTYIRIEISNISMRDNGTYGTYQLLYHDTCFILFVMQIRPESGVELEENQPVYIHAHPRASLITRALTNATMAWLIDGKTVNQTANFIQQDGLIWIPHIHRGLDGKNVTYRALHDNGVVTEVYCTVKVRYGPSRPLVLIPEQTQYYLTEGDVMPDITCTAECKPQCTISWGNYSNDGTLRLGVVTLGDTGRYTCTATRDGAWDVMQFINIYVSEERPWLLQLFPQKTVYFLSVGDTMPEISCTVNCWPPCEVSWGEHSSNEKLSLGTVAKETNGEYICIATRKGSLRRVERRIIVHVQDNMPFTVAIACLATIQALTMVGLGLCVLIVYRRTKQSLCRMCFGNIKTKSPNDANDRPALQSANIGDLEEYEDINNVNDKRQTFRAHEKAVETGSEPYDDIILSNSPSQGAKM